LPASAKASPFWFAITPKGDGFVDQPKPVKEQFNLAI
jgi:hypothetical protein